jgi:uncharacterized protein YidB (DUF937 family)
MSEFAGQVIGTVSAASAAGWGVVLAQLLGTAEGATGGGLPVLIAQFENVGLGEKIRSWIHGPEKAAITPGEIEQALSPDQLVMLARQTGLPPAELSAALAELLPHAVDHVTPNGVLPQPGTSADLASLVAQVRAGGSFPGITIE